MFAGPSGCINEEDAFWDKMTDGAKKLMLMNVGVRNPRERKLVNDTETLSEANKVKIVQPGFVSALHMGHEAMKRDEADEAEVKRQRARQRFLQEWWTKNEVLLVCICDEVGGRDAGAELDYFWTSLLRSRSY